MRITQAEARKHGFKIDRHVYPPLAYKGPRFYPIAIEDCFTELEEKLAVGLAAALKAAGCLGGISFDVDTIAWANGVLGGPGPSTFDELHHDIRAAIEEARR